MFRISRYLQALHQGTPPRSGAPQGPVVVWNLGRRCNLTCKHCYSALADREFPGELSTAELIRVMEDLHACGVPVLILSGGEPLMRVALAEIRLRRDHGIKVGMRYTRTEKNADDLSGLLDLMDSEAIDKLYLSHLNYGGRGRINRRTDAYHRSTRRALDLLFERCWNELERSLYQGIRHRQSNPGGDQTRADEKTVGKIQRLEQNPLRSRHQPLTEEADTPRPVPACS